MTGAITWEQLAFFIGLCVALLTLWYRVETRISKSALEAKIVAETALKTASDAHTNLHNFKLEVAENYAKGDFIKDVERRVISRIDALVQEIHGMRKDFQDAIVKMASQHRQE